jgi:hypothetical protein
MTTISETAPTIAHNRPHAGIWHRTARALGKLWAKMVASLEAPSAAARREVPPEVWRFPPF